MRGMERTGENLLTREVLAFFLVLALLLCHGLSETVHQYATHGASPMGSGSSSTQTPVKVLADGGGDPDVGAGIPGHAATLLLFLTAAAWSWLRRPRGWGPALPPPHPPNSHALTLPRPQGAPALALLEVYRL